MLSNEQRYLISYKMVAHILISRIRSGASFEDMKRLLVDLSGKLGTEPKDTIDFVSVMLKLVEKSLVFNLNLEFLEVEASLTESDSTRNSEDEEDDRLEESGVEPEDNDEDDELSRAIEQEDENPPQPENDGGADPPPVEDGDDKK
jgi:hypothetical protein